MEEYVAQHRKANRGSKAKRSIGKQLWHGTTRLVVGSAVLVGFGTWLIWSLGREPGETPAEPEEAAPANVSVWFADGMAGLQTWSPERCAEASSDLGRVLEVEPGHPSALGGRTLARVCATVGLPEASTRGEIEEAAGRAIASNSGRAHGLLALAELHRRTGGAELAADYLKQAVTADPNEPLVMAMQGRSLLEAAGRRDEARILVEQRVGFLADTGRIEERDRALKLLRDAAAKSPVVGLAESILADELLARGRPLEALPLFDKPPPRRQSESAEDRMNGANRDPLAARAHLDRARVLVTLGEFGRAREDLDKTLVAFPGFARAQLLKAGVLYHLDRDPTARSHADQALGNEGGLTAAERQQAYLLLAAIDLEAGLPLASDGALTDVTGPDEPYAVLLRVRNHLVGEQPELAAAALSDFEGEFPKDVLLRLAVAHEQAGDSRRAGTFRAQYLEGSRDRLRRTRKETGALSNIRPLPS